MTSVTGRDQPQLSRFSPLTSLLPGIALSAAVAVAAFLVAPLAGLLFPLPVMVIALLIGMAANPLIADRDSVRPGMAFCGRVILRWAVALLGLRIALADIADLGLSTALLVIAAMVVTLLSGFWLAHVSGRSPGFGALAGTATAVCGASATLAAASVIPDYPGKQTDIAFIVVGVNAMATIAILVYPPICILLGLEPQATGVMLGATIHDVAQVVGAGYAVSETVGNAAVVVKLFRVFLLLPVILCLSWYFTSVRDRTPNVSVPVPTFAFVFLLLCLVNSAVRYFPTVMPAYAAARDVLLTASTWGLLLAIGALGLGTSLSAILALGWRHMATVVGTTIVILVTVTIGLVVVGHFHPS